MTDLPLDITILPDEVVEENVNGDIKLENLSDKKVLTVGNTGLSLTYLKEGYNAGYRKNWLLLDYLIEFASSSGRYVDNIKIFYFAILQLFQYLETNPELLNNLEIDGKEIKQDTNLIMKDFIVKFFEKFGYDNIVKFEYNPINNNYLLRMKIEEIKRFMSDMSVLEYLESMTKNIENKKIRITKLLS